MQMAADYVLWGTVRKFRPTRRNTVEIPIHIYAGKWWKIAQDVYELISKSSIHLGKCWTISICVKKHIGQFLYTCWKVLKNSTVCCITLKNSSVYVRKCKQNVIEVTWRCLEMSAIQKDKSWKIPPTCCLVLRHLFVLQTFVLFHRYGDREKMQGVRTLIGCNCNPEFNDDSICWS